MYAFQNLKAPVNIGSGVADYLLLAPVSWFTETGIKDIADPHGVVIEDDHVLRAGKGFIRIDLAPFRNEITAKTINEVPAKTLDQELKAFIPGSYAELHETIKNLMNTPLIVLIRDNACAEDLWYQFGNNGVYAYISPDFTTGTVKEGVKGYEAKISFINPFIQIYEGVITALPVGAAGLSSVFYAAGNNQISGNVAAMATLYSSGISNIQQIYTQALAVATNNIMQLHFANDQGEVLNDYLINVDLSSLDAFVETIYDWIAANGSGQYVELDGTQLRLVDDDAAAAYLAVGFPQNFLLAIDNNKLLCVDDETLLIH